MFEKKKRIHSLFISSKETKISCSAYEVQAYTRSHEAVDYTERCHTIVMCPLDVFVVINNVVLGRSSILPSAISMLSLLKDLQRILTSNTREIKAKRALDSVATKTLLIFGALHVYQDSCSALVAATSKKKSCVLFLNYLREYNSQRSSNL